MAAGRDQRHALTDRTSPGVGWWDVRRRPPDPRGPDGPTLEPADTDLHPGPHKQNQPILLEPAPCPTAGSSWPEAPIQTTTPLGFRRQMCLIPERECGRLRPPWHTAMVSDSNVSTRRSGVGHLRIPIQRSRLDICPRGLQSELQHLDAAQQCRGSGSLLPPRLRAAGWSRPVRVDIPTTICQRPS